MGGGDFISTTMGRNKNVGRSSTDRRHLKNSTPSQAIKTIKICSFTNVSYTNSIFIVLI